MDMPGLDYVANWLRVTDNPLLTSLPFLARLRTVDGLIQFFRNQRLPRIQLSQLDSQAS